MERVWVTLLILYDNFSYVLPSHPFVSECHVFYLVVKW